MNLMQETLSVLDDEDDKDDKTKELPLGKETEANLFKSRSIFIYGTITQELAQKVCTHSWRFPPPATKTSASM